MTCCNECLEFGDLVRKDGRARRCRVCGSEFERVFDPEQALRQLIEDADVLAEFAPTFTGRAQRYEPEIVHHVSEHGLTEEEQEQRERRDAAKQTRRRRAVELWGRREVLRTEAARTRDPELSRAVAVIDHLIERCGSERTRGHRVGGEVIAPKLSRLVGEAFADAETRARASARPAPKDERAAEIRALAEQAKLTIERHGAELLRDAAWVWSATDVATEEAERGFEEICGDAVARIAAEQERRKKAEKEQR